MFSSRANASGQCWGIRHVELGGTVSEKVDGRGLPDLTKVGDARGWSGSTAWWFISKGVEAEEGIVCIGLVNFAGCPPGQLLVGVTQAPWVELGNDWNGTLVAPKASVVADMVTNATLSGSFYSFNFDLHQGRFLFYVPFAGARWVPVCTTAGGSTATPERTPRID